MKKTSTFDAQNNIEETFAKILSLRKQITRLQAAKEKPAGRDPGKKERAELALKVLQERLGRETAEMASHAERGLYTGLCVDLEKPGAIRPFFMDWEKTTNHKLTLATTQTGKTRLMASDIRQAVAKGWNVVAYDPKGGRDQEIVAWTLEAAEAVGRESEWMYISAVFPEISDRFNPIFGFRNEEVASLVALVAVPSSDTGADAQFFSSIAYKTVLGLLTAFEYLERATDSDGKITESKRRYELLNYYRQRAAKAETDGYLSGEKHFEENHQEEIDRLSVDLATKRPFERTFITFRELSDYAPYHKIEELRKQLDAFAPANRSGDAMLHARAMALLDDLLAQDRQFFQKISASLSTILTQLSYGKIGEIFCSVRINPFIDRLYRRDKGVVAVIQPAPLKFQKVSEMVSKIIMQMCQLAVGTAGATGKPLPRRTLFLIDEMSDVIYPGIENLFNKGAGLGFTIYGYTQSFKDFEAKLGKTAAEKCLDNINTYQIGRMNDNTSCKIASEKLGSVRKQVYRMMGNWDDHRIMTDIKEELIANPEFFTLLPAGRFIVIHDRKRLMVEAPYQPDPAEVLQIDCGDELKDRELMADEHAQIEAGFTEAEAAASFALAALNQNPDRQRSE